MKALKSSLPFIAAICIILWVFKSWIFSPVTLGGDFNFVDYSFFRNLSTAPYMWDTRYNNGFGQLVLYTLPFFPYNFFLNLITPSITDTFLLHKLIYLWPILIITFISILHLSKQVIKNKYAQASTVVLYFINPYFIMLASGGQMGVALAYGLAPLSISIFLKILRGINSEKGSKELFKDYFIGGLIAALLLVADTRYFILIAGIVTVLYLANLATVINKPETLKKYLVLGSIILALVFLIHSFWLIPSIFIQAVALPEGYGAIDSVKFFSFARLAHAITWSHPNYPDNNFGVVTEVTGYSFMFPVFAFLYIKNRRKIVQYFAAIALIAVFLAKGANPPFGELYIWMFQHVPAFNTFRDSTKFYLLISVSYSVLIGLTLEQLWSQKPSKNVVPKSIIGLAFIVITVIPWYPTISGQINGTLGYKTFPSSFQQLNEQIKNDRQFGRVLWIPQREYYGLDSQTHPAVFFKDLQSRPLCLEIFCPPAEQKIKQSTSEIAYSKEQLLKEIDEQMSLFARPESPELFRQLAINYIVVSPDLDKTIYIYDRKYDSTIYQYYREKLNTINWVRPAGSLLYQTEKKGYLFTVNDQPLDFQLKNPTEYSLQIENPTTPIIFAQTFNSRWTLVQGVTKVASQKNKLGLNSFDSTSLKAGPAKVIFEGQEYASVSWYLSLSVLVIVMLTITVINLRKRKNIVS